jgi:hypothetical protein
MEPNSSRSRQPPLSLLEKGEEKKLAHFRCDQQKKKMGNNKIQPAVKLQSWRLWYTLLYHYALVANPYLSILHKSKNEQNRHRLLFVPVFGRLIN